MSGPLDKLRKLAREAELEVICYQDGRVLVVGGLVNVHYWPDSRRRTAYIDGSPNSHRFATPRNVINLATKGTPQ